MLAYAPHRRVLLKTHPQFSEKWLQERIAEEPSLLGLGDLDVKDLERNQPRAGRLDMLLFDPESNTRYEVELQLGGTDESHIIRTIEYWDIERRRYPQYEHVGVIVAEEITARFFNVISLFNGSIPLTKHGGGCIASRSPTVSWLRTVTSSANWSSLPARTTAARPRDEVRPDEPWLGGPLPAEAPSAASGDIRVIISGWR